MSAIRKPIEKVEQLDCQEELQERTDGKRRVNTTGELTQAFEELGKRGIRGMLSIMFDGQVKK